MSNPDATMLATAQQLDYTGNKLNQIDESLLKAQLVLLQSQPGGLNADEVALQALLT